MSHCSPCASSPTPFIIHSFPFLLAVLSLLFSMATPSIKFLMVHRQTARNGKLSCVVLVFCVNTNQRAAPISTSL